MPSPVQPGQIIKGKYRVDRVLGEGGMGVVVAGSHVGLGQRVAIKFLHPAMLAHPEIVERFAREARAASRLESDHVARVTDVDTMEDGAPFMVMEYLEGSDLSTVRASGQPLPLHVAAGYIVEACEALGEAHALGIVHRDIKPANLFLARRGQGKTRLKVLDFGISKGTGTDGEPGMTRTSTVMGSAHYMSPEQMLTPREVDHRTDIWALGVTLFELTTAQLPFPGESVPQVCATIMSTQPPTPSSVNHWLPPGFDAIVMRCLARHPAERFGSVVELTEALTPFVVSTAPSFGRAPMTSSAQVAVQGVTANPTSDPGMAAPSQNAGAYGADSLAATPLMFPLPAAPAASPSRPWATPSSSPQVQLAPQAVVHTTAAVSRTDAAPAPRSKAPLMAAAGVLGVVLLAGSTLALVFRSPTSTSNAAASAPSAVVDAPRPPPDAPSSIAAPEPAPAIAPSAEVVTSADATAPSTPPRVPSAAAAHPGPRQPAETAKAPTAKAPTAKAPTTNCNPPFTVDAQGVKRAKPECL